MRVLILHAAIPTDAPPDEQDALVQAAAIQEALRELGHESSALAVTLDLAKAAACLRRLRPDVVFNLVETLDGQGRLIHLVPALLDSLGLPYTGAGTEATFTTSNKLLGKVLLDANRIPTPPWFTVTSLKRGGAGPRGRVIIKSVWEHASVGLDEDSVMEVASATDLWAECERRRPRLGGECFAEAFIDGREFNLSLLAGDRGEVDVLPPAEIVFTGYGPGKARVVGYRAKWDAQSYEFGNTRRCFSFPGDDGPLLDRLRAIARQCWSAFGLRGYARVDFRVSTDGAPYVLEINVNPCLAPDAGFVAAVREGGLTFRQAIARILGDVPPGDGRG